MIKQQHLKVFIFVASICYPFLVHYLILSEQYFFAAIYIIGLICTVAIQNYIASKLILGTIILSVAIIIVLILFYKIRLVIMLPPVLIPLAWAYIFGKSLLENKTAWLTLIAQKIRNKELDEKEKHYTRQVTKVWFAFFIVLAVESIIVAVFYDFETWSYITNFLNYIFIVVLMFIEFTLRKVVLNKLSHPSFVTFIKQLISAQRNQ